MPPERWGAAELAPRGSSAGGGRPRLGMLRPGNGLRPPRVSLRGQAVERAQQVRTERRGERLRDVSDVLVDEDAADDRQALCPAAEERRQVDGVDPQARAVGAAGGEDR